MSDLSFLLTYLRYQYGRLQALNASDAGSVTLEKVVITAVLVVGAIAVGGILVEKATGSANNISTP